MQKHEKHAAMFDTVVLVLEIGKIMLYFSRIQLKIHEKKIIMNYIFVELGKTFDRND